MPIIFTTDIAARLITAFLGTLAFGILLNVSAKKLPCAALGGLFTYAVYELAALLGANVLVCAFASSLFMTLYSEIFARILRTPALMFLLPCAIPIVPGSGLYYTIYNLLFYNETSLFEHGARTLAIALGIALGFGIGMTLVGCITGIPKRTKKGSTSKKSL